MSIFISKIISSIIIDGISSIDDHCTIGVTDDILDDEDYDDDDDF